MIEYEAKTACIDLVAAGDDRSGGPQARAGVAGWSPHVHLVHGPVQGG